MVDKVIVGFSAHAVSLSLELAVIICPDASLATGARLYAACSFSLFLYCRRFIL